MHIEPLIIQPEIGVPFPAKLPYVDLRVRVDTACKTMEMLRHHGLTLEEITKEDKDFAAAIVVAYAQQPEKVSKKVSQHVAAALPNGSMIMVDAILREFSYKVASDAADIREVVKNKLLLETESGDGRIRLRALELLGKISDVGLFTDKTELTITHQTSDDLREKLRSKLQKLGAGSQDINIDQAEDAVLIEPKHTPISLSAQLGIDANEYDDE